jgi:hypothetical protein
MDSKKHTATWSITHTGVFMKYEAHITVTYRVSVYSDQPMTRQQVLDHIAENEIITEHKLIDVDYAGATVEESK